MLLAIIGQCPPRRGGLPLRGETGDRLASWAGMDPDELLERVDARNVVQHPDFTHSQARVAGYALAQDLAGRRAVLLGATVATWMGCEPRPYLEWRRHPESNMRYVVVPHPSGRNRELNGSALGRAAGEMLRRWLHPCACSRLECQGCSHEWCIATCRHDLLATAGSTLTHRKQAYKWVGPFGDQVRTTEVEPFKNRAGYPHDPKLGR